MLFMLCMFIYLINIKIETEIQIFFQYFFKHIVIWYPLYLITLLYLFQKYSKTHFRIKIRQQNCTIMNHTLNLL